MKKELKEKEKKTLLNNDIPSNEVLLIDENGQKKIILKEKAIEKAKELGLDLICVSLKNIPPVCKILDYKKLLFDIKKKNKKKKSVIKEKELRISQTIDDHDLNLKLKKIIEWIGKKNASVRFTIKVLSLEKKHLELADKKSQKIIEDLKKELPQIELTKSIKRIGKNISFTLYKNNKKK